MIHLFPLFDGKSSIFYLKSHSHKEVDSHRRRYLADGKVYRRQYAESDGVVAQLQRDRQHYRDEDVHSRIRIDKAARYEEDDIYYDKEDHPVGGDAGQKLLCGLGNSEERTAVGKKRRRRHYEHYPSGGLGRIHHDIKEVLKLYLSVNKDSDYESVDHRNCRRLSGSENSAIDSSKDDNGH